MAEDEDGGVGGLAIVGLGFAGAFEGRHRWCRLEGDGWDVVKRFSNCQADEASGRRLMLKAGHWKMHGGFYDGVG